MVNCNISYDNNQQGIYFSGQTLSGAIEITNEKNRSIKGITLKIEGFAKCKWTEHEGSGKHRRTIYYKGREDYISTFSYLIGSYNGEAIDLAEGVHKFNFICALPPQLPTSLESKYGYIRYQIKVEVERPWKSDFKFCYAFTVLKPLDLNFENQSLKLPLKAEVSKSFFLGFSNKNLYMSAEVPFCGYVSGQSAPVSVSINNESGVEVYEITIELMKIIYYNSDTPRMRTRRREEKVAMTKHQGVPAKKKGAAMGNLVIPAVPPTNTGTCRTIQVFYEILVTAKTSGMHRNLTVVLPITIGTVPLLSTYQNIYPALQQDQIQSGWNIQPSTSQATYPATQPAYSTLETSYPSAPVANLNPDLPPPSYQEAMMTTTQEVDNEEGLNDQQAFNPKYPVFNFANQAPMPSQALAPPPYSLPPTDTKNEKKPL
ncbi:unnamed protein product [Chironomus riparius]|uniref:Arrestin C-terminal-like domain-containing protein n=1 Tax=Chironomus riparius TaxID=315576 RepID=A0A9N9WT13_9DIPT|nr:unnamed protein product [Chironomus riparius]